MFQCNFCNATFQKLQCNFCFRWWHVAEVGFRGVGFRTCWFRLSIPSKSKMIHRKRLGKISPNDCSRKYSSTYTWHMFELSSDKYTCMSEIVSVRLVSLRARVVGLVSMYVLIAFVLACSMSGDSLCLGVYRRMATQNLVLVSEFWNMHFACSTALATQNTPLHFLFALLVFLFLLVFVPPSFSPFSSFFFCFIFKFFHFLLILPDFLRMIAFWVFCNACMESKM